MKLLTVFTATYNRGYCLNQVYESLVRQTNSSFIWMIIDDGSTDDTAPLIQEWIKENKIEIQYLYQENQGMNSAHNTAYANIKTPWNVSIDSDDYMPDDAVELIIKNIQNLDSKFAGIVGLDRYTKGNLIGSQFPDTITQSTLSDLYHKHHVKGDKKIVYRTEIINKYAPYPILEGEKFIPPGYLYRLIDKDYVLKPVNETFVIVNYQKDGFTKNLFWLYRNNPRGFAIHRVLKIQLSKNSTERFKNMVHLISCSLFAKDIHFLKQTNSAFLIALAFPFGLVLNGYIRLKTSKIISL
ncbi:glycosyltransferase family 2 protein [Flavobacterium praedii]|jgi:glycosyltransferase involved in cell wall biosynthesis|uniref:glycosyltransferase family 2 protein n=1 Tax=Flavobacterium praedii TaxID=3002900 RepID=UPI002482096F|nr:glycosyltransferase family A protein [Flavobacterium praedii]